MATKKTTKKKKVTKAVDPVSGLTVAQTKARLKSAIRREWRRTSRYKHIKSVRYRNEDPECRSTYAVDCEICGRAMGQSEQTTYVTSTGRRRRTSVYHIDHVCDTGMPPINNIKTDLGEYALALLQTPLRVLCVDCDRDVTKAQMELRHSLKGIKNE